MIGVVVIHVLLVGAALFVRLQTPAGNLEVLDEQECAEWIARAKQLMGKEHGHAWTKRWRVVVDVPRATSPVAQLAERLQMDPATTHAQVVLENSAWWDHDERIEAPLAQHTIIALNTASCSTGTVFPRGSVLPPSTPLCTLSPGSSRYLLHLSPS